MDNNFYVYEWIRLDTNEPFYVGKGHKNRCYQLTRGNNNHFNNIVKSIPVAVNILHDNLDEQTAFGLEVWYIREYRDIIGYDLCNINDGGEGQTLCGEKNPMYGKGYLISGESNPMYGKNYRDYMTEEELLEHDRKISETNKGEKNPMYGKNYRDYMTEEELLEHDRKMSEAQKGKNNPMYGKNPRDYMTEEAKKEHDRKISEANKGKNHPQAKSVIAIINDKIFGAFDYAKQGAEYFNCDNSSIVKCCKGKHKSAGKYNGYKIVWRYIEIIEL